MKILDEFRDGSRAESLVAAIQSKCSRTWTIMEVCGGQTHGLLRYGIDQALRESIELVHGPGCPVCVTPTEAIDEAISLSNMPDTTLMSFGDMLRVPGNVGTLLKARASGGDVKMVYSPLDAVRFAREHAERQVVFFAVGFETTAPATALAILQADRWKLKNFYMLCSHVRVLPAMEQIATDSQSGIDAFLAAGHVCSVMGLSEYVPFIERFSLPVVATGFEPVDLLYGILECVCQLESGRAVLSNAYPRSVQYEGNIEARKLIDRVYQISDQCWRGFGRIERGGLALRPEWQRFDARNLITSIDRPTTKESECPSSQVLSGKLRPDRCPFFGNACSPEHPLGAPMVSSEGACAAYFAYHQRTSVDNLAST